MCVLEHLHDEDAELVVDGTGDVQKGSPTVGPQRRHAGIAGSIDSAQVAAYLVHAGRRGTSAVDRDL
ncbi:hypothetical protein GCM10010416_79020 [Streptomyces caniferus]